MEAVSLTDPIMDFSDAPNQTPPAAAPRRRGRPRSPETIERDAQVLTVLREQGPQTREQLVERFQVKPSLVYLALWRLRRTGEVERTSDESARYVWRVTT